MNCFPCPAQLQALLVTWYRIGNCLASLRLVRSHPFQCGTRNPPTIEPNPALDTVKNSMHRLDLELARLIVHSSGRLRHLTLSSYVDLDTMNYQRITLSQSINAALFDARCSLEEFCLESSHKFSPNTTVTDADVEEYEFEFRWQEKGALLNRTIGKCDEKVIIWELYLTYDV